MSHSKSYTDQYVGQVVSVDDPEKKCRVKVNVYDIFDGVPTKDLPWASFSLGLGSRANEGLVTPVQVGDVVWVRFMNGSTRYPIITGSAQAMPGGTPNLPPEARQGEGGYQHKRTADQPPAEEAPYYQDVVYSQNKALIQLCRSGTIRVTQMDSGSAIEIKSNGDMIIHCEGNCFTSVEGNTLEEYNGNFEQRIKGDFKQTISGTMQNISQGSAAYGSSQEGLTLSAATTSTMSGGGGLQMNGPCRFNNGISATSVKADTSIVAPDIHEGTGGDPDR